MSFKVSFEKNDTKYHILAQNWYLQNFQIWIELTRQYVELLGGYFRNNKESICVYALTPTVKCIGNVNPVTVVNPVINF